MKKDELVFGEYRLPAMESGRYRITGEQRLAADGTDLYEPVEEELEVAVTGLRFTLPPDRVHGRFPAPGAAGDFGDVLPHIVLTSATLPWQREPGASATRTEQPWLALLVVDHADDVTDVQTAPVDELLRSDRYIGRTDAEPGDEEVCQFVELDAELFDAIAPREHELRWLTHVRTLRGPQGEQSFSVVVANRLPAPEGVSTCHLVSLEGVFARRPPSTETHVRLVVLDSWTFNSTPVTRGFGAIAGSLDAGTLRGVGEDPRHAGGYTLLEHTMRQGAATASWYRGPLIPPHAAPSAPDGASDSSDELLRYDPGVGLFDVSLAAAWQLGRLLALADAELSDLIAAWKAEGQREQAAAGEQELLSGKGVDPRAALDERRERFVDAVLEPSVGRLVT